MIGQLIHICGSNKVNSAGAEAEGKGAVAAAPESLVQSRKVSINLMFNVVTSCTSCWDFKKYAD